MRSLAPTEHNGKHTPVTTRDRPAANKGLSRLGTPTKAPPGPSAAAVPLPDSMFATEPLAPRSAGRLFQAESPGQSPGQSPGDQDAFADAPIDTADIDSSRREAWRLNPSPNREAKATAATKSDTQAGVPTDDGRRLTFRGQTYDAAVAAAEAALGVRPRVSAAHRIRRGGIAGFFATDLGVEVQVDVEGETIDEAVERLVDAGGPTDRERWIRELAKAAGINAETLLNEDQAINGTPPAQPQAPRDDEYLTEDVFGGMVAALHADRVFDAIAAETSVNEPESPVVAKVAVAEVEPIEVEPVAAEPVVVEPVVVEPTEAVPVAVAAEPVSASAIEPELDIPMAAEAGAVEDVAPEVASWEDGQAVTTQRRNTVPTRHHVDLAVAAAAEMVKLTGAQVPGATITIQVTVATNDGRSVSTEARLETPPASTPRRKSPAAAKNGAAA